MAGYVRAFVGGAQDCSRDGSGRGRTMTSAQTCIAAALRQIAELTEAEKSLR